jgi:hypothetical protein
LEFEAFTASDSSPDLLAEMPDANHHLVHPLLAQQSKLVKDEGLAGNLDQGFRSICCESA